jgi:hypothetical protein
MMTVTQARKHIRSPECRGVYLRVVITSPEGQDISEHILVGKSHLSRVLRGLPGDAITNLTVWVRPVSGTFLVN